MLLLIKPQHNEMIQIKPVAKLTRTFCATSTGSMCRSSSPLHSLCIRAVILSNMTGSLRPSRLRTYIVLTSAAVSSLSSLLLLLSEGTSSSALRCTASADSGGLCNRNACAIDCAASGAGGGGNGGVSPPLKPRARFRKIDGCCALCAALHAARGAAVTPGCRCCTSNNTSMRAASSKGALRLQRVASLERGAGLLRFLLSVQGQNHGAWPAVVIAVSLAACASVCHTSNTTTSVKTTQTHFSEVDHAEPD
jgi:hypothetical protein